MVATNDTTSQRSVTGKEFLDMAELIATLSKSPRLDSTTSPPRH
jgi:hypothetical protein